MTEQLLSNIENCIPLYYKNRIKLFQNHIGNKIIDALLFMPNSVIEKKLVTELNYALNEDIIIANIFVDFIDYNNFSTKKLIIIYGSVGRSKIELLFFNSKPNFITNCFQPGKISKITGKLGISNKNIYQIINPQIANFKTEPGFYNIYPLRRGITQESIYSIENKALDILKNCSIEEWLPDEVMDKYHFYSFYISLLSIHKPKLINLDLKNNVYKQRLCFDEIFAEQLIIQLNKLQNSAQGFGIKNEKKLINKFIDLLPFQLTESQINASNDIISDMSKDLPMHRLIQGDVGSGKTIVAILSMLYAIESGHQCAFLAPTDLLVRQHFNTLTKYLEHIGINIEILTSYEKGKVRKRIIDNVQLGITNIIIGTHAIFNDKLEFYNLGLVVIDEQHRFGVEQRLKLIQKGKNPHILSMTATPIPRTTIMSLYGDIDVSLIEQKPIGRKEIITTSFQLDKSQNTIPIEIIEAIKRILKLNQKVYWICPLVEESEKMDFAYVLKRYEFLKSYFEDYVDMLHGRMKGIEKQEALEKFYKGITKIIVSTTVIEVGIDDPNATVIIIENAERFGLAQLHQLRGRVGRSNLQSYCILLYDKNCSIIAKQRIKIMKSTNNGFFIAEEDLKLRGGGEIHGTKQSGIKKYKTFEIGSDQDIITEYMLTASKLARNIVRTGSINMYKNLLYLFSPKFNLDVTKSF